VRIGPPGTGKNKWMDDTHGIGNWVTAPDDTGRWFGRGMQFFLIFFFFYFFGALRMNEPWVHKSLRKSTQRSPTTVPHGGREGVLVGLKGGNRLLDGTTSKHSFESQIAELHKQCTLKEVEIVLDFHVCLNRGNISCCQV